MDTFIIVLVFVFAILIFSNWNDIVRVLKPPKPKSPPEQIDTGEFILFKPAGFTTDTATYSGGKKLFAAEIYSETRSGAIAIENGEQIKEEFNDAWAVVSVTPGDTLEICRNLAKDNAAEVLDESEEVVGGDRILTITVTKRTMHFQLEITHKVIASGTRNKTYELRASVLHKKKAEYGDDIAEVIRKFQLV